MTEQRFRCRGKRVFVKEKREDLNKKLSELKETAKGKKGEALTPLIAKRKEIERHIEALADKHDSLYLGRGGCGHDLSEQINAIPNDGEEYTYQCPKCGNAGTARKAPAVEA